MRIEQPTIEAIEEAKKHPNGFAYAIDKIFDIEDFVPPSAIRGCWKVNSRGIIEGEFIPNPNYLEIP